MSLWKSGQLSLKQVVPWVLAFLAVDVLCVTVPALNRPWLVYVFEILVPAIALGACLWRLREVDDPTRRLWVLLAVGLGYWTLGMGLSAWEELFQHLPFEMAFFSDFAFFFYGVPILLAISMPVDGPRFALFPWMDALQGVFAGYLAYVTIFSVQPLSTHSIHPISITLLVLTYNVENITLAAACGLRLLASPRDGEAKRFYGILFTFLVIYAVGTGIYNNMAVADAGNHAPAWLSHLSFLILTCLALCVRTGEEVPTQGLARRKTVELFIDHASPIFFTLALLTLGLIVLREYFSTGIVAIVVSLAVYWIRTTVLQTRYLRAQQDLREARDRLETLSLQDGLTGIANRRHFDRTLDLEWHRAARNRQPLTLVMLDLDLFKHLNDTQGHPAGDRCLIEVAGALVSIAGRSTDVVARYGGEEFAVILPETAIESAAPLAERMREAILDLRISNEIGNQRFVTASFGLATLIPGPDEPSDRLIEHADRALYRAKELGRNRVEIAEPNEPNETHESLVPARSHQHQHHHPH